MNKTRGIATKEDFTRTLSYVEVVCIVSVMTAVCGLTIIGNALVMLSFIMDKKLRTLNNYFYLSLAVSDITIGVFSMPLFTHYLIRGKWTLGRVLCDMWLAQDNMCSNASCLNMLIIGFDRYFSITSPLSYRARRTGKRVALMISCVWIISFLIWPPWIYAWSYIEGRRTVPENECYVQFLETNFYVTIITSILDYYLPVTIMLVLYYKIWRRTKAREKYLASMKTGCQTQSPALQKNHSGEDWKKRARLFFTRNSKDKTTQNISKVVDEAERYTEAILLKETPGVDTREEVVLENRISDEEIETCIEKLPDFTSECNTSSSETVDSKSSNKKKMGGKSDNKAARVLTFILLSFIITTTPYNVLVIVNNLDSTHSMIPDGVWNFFYYLFYVNSTLNPLCYALANENFRRTYWKILTCSWSKKRSQGVYISSNYSDKSLRSTKSSPISRTYLGQIVTTTAVTGVDLSKL